MAQREDVGWMDGSTKTDAVHFIFSSHFHFSNIGLLLWLFTNLPKGFVPKLSQTFHQFHTKCTSEIVCKRQCMEGQHYKATHLDTTTTTITTTVECKQLYIFISGIFIYSDTFSHASDFIPKNQVRDQIRVTEVWEFKDTLNFSSILLYCKVVAVTNYNTLS